MKIQACTFTRSPGSPKERGIAYQDYFGSNEVQFILDEFGKKVKKLWDYRLIEPTFENPHVGIDLDQVSLANKISAVVLPKRVDTD